MVLSDLNNKPPCRICTGRQDSNKQIGDCISGRFASMEAGLMRWVKTQFPPYPLHSVSLSLLPEMFTKRLLCGRLWDSWT